MNVSNNLFGNIGSSLLSNVGSTAATTTTASPSSIPPPMAGAASTSISTPGQFFSEMQQLSQSNPTEFKTVAAAVAKSFHGICSVGAYRGRSWGEAFKAICSTGVSEVELSSIRGARCPFTG